MRIVALASQKGGSGKSTVAINLAVAAMRANSRVLLFDLDPQRTAEQWYHKRNNEQPQLIAVESNQLPEAIRRATQSGVDYLFLDTAGRDAPSTAAAIRAADFCLVPCRPTPQDMKAIPPTVDTIKRLNKPFAFVLTQCPARGRRTSEARAGLSTHGEVAPIPVIARTAYQDASGNGLGVIEFEPSSKATLESRALWRWLKKELARAVNG